MLIMDDELWIIDVGLWILDCGLCISRAELCKGNCSFTCLPSGREFTL